MALCHRDADDTGEEGAGMPDFSLDHQIGPEPTAKAPEPAAPVVESAAPEPEAKAAEPEKVEPEKPEVEKPEVEAKTDGPDGDDDKHPVPRKALQEERRKRQEAQQQLQEAQRQLAHHQGQLSVHQQQGTNPQQGGIDPEQAKQARIDEFLADPDVFIDKRATAIAQDKFLRSSNAAAERRHDDYIEKRDAALEAGKENPQVVQMILSADDPGEKAYQLGKSILGFGKAESIDELHEEWRVKESADIEAKLRGQLGLEAAAKAPTSGAGARGSGSTTAPVFGGPKDFKDILPGGGL